MRRTLYSLLASLIMLPVSAFAVPITGSISMYGQFTPVAPDGSAVSLGAATGLDITGDSFVVETTTGTFAADGIVKGDTGYLADFQFNPLNPAPVNPLWAIGGFQFALYSVSIVSQSDRILELSGSGWLGGNGYTSTYGHWSFKGGSAPGRFFFGSSTGSTSVPEPGALLMFGSGLLGLGVTAAMRRRRRTVV